MDPFDMLNEFPDLGGHGGGPAATSPYVGSPPGGAAGAGLLTTAHNVPAPMLASSSAKIAGSGAGGAGRGASAAAPTGGGGGVAGVCRPEPAQISDYSPEWAWSDVSFHCRGC